MSQPGSAASAGVGAAQTVVPDYFEFDDFKDITRLPCFNVPARISSCSGSREGKIIFDGGGQHCFQNFKFKKKQARTKLTYLEWVNSMEPEERKKVCDYNGLLSHWTHTEPPRPIVLTIKL